MQNGRVWISNQALLKYLDGFRGSISLAIQFAKSIVVPDSIRFYLKSAFVAGLGLLKMLKCFMSFSDIKPGISRVRFQIQNTLIVAQSLRMLFALSRNLAQMRLDMGLFV